MKATINGIDIEGTKEEIVELIRMLGTMQQMQPLPQLPNPLQPFIQPHIGTPSLKPPWYVGDYWCGIVMN